MQNQGQAPIEEQGPTPRPGMSNDAAGPRHEGALEAGGDGRPFTPWQPGAASASAGSLPPVGKASRIQPPPTGVPAVAPGADLARVHVPWRWTALCFVITFAVFVALIPRFVLYSSPPTGDQVYYMLDTISLVQDHDLLLNNNYTNQDWQRFYRDVPRPPDFVGMTAPDPLPPMLANSTARPRQEQYAFHLPGLPTWLIPAWVIGGLFSLWWPACVVFMSLLGALLATNIFLFAYELTGRAWIAWFVWLPVAFSSPLMTYSYLIFTEMPVGLLMIWVFRRLALGWGANGPLRLLLIGLALGNIPWLAWRCLPIAGMLGIYALVQYWRDRRARQSADLGEIDESELAPAANNGSFGQVTLVLGPALVLGALLLAYNVYLFGRVIPDSSVLEQGRIAVFHYPWRGVEEATLYVSAIFGQLFDRAFGLLPYAPIYVLTFVGVIAAFRLGGPYLRVLLWIVLVSQPYMLIVTSFDNWNGVWCPPARYLATFVPFMAGLIAISLLLLSRSIAYKALAFLLAIPGWVLMAVMLNDARLFWPYPAGGAVSKLTSWENSPVKLDLAQFIPIFSPVDDVTNPRNTAWITLAVVGIVLLCYALILLQRRSPAEARPHLPYAAQGAIWAVALLAIGSSWYFTNALYLKHRTQVTEVGRWALQPPVKIDEAYGITYFDGKVYVTSYNRNTTGGVGVFDPSTHEYTPIEPISNTLPFQFGHVSDIKARPDGNLYVLNNGVADGELLVMRPDGTVLKGIDLQGKTPIATGLNFGPAGDIFVADMLGGRVVRYRPGGGEPTGVYAGMNKGFNNPAGVAVTPEGNIYAAEQGFARLQKLDSKGNFVKSINLACKPMHVLLSGDFLDVTCDAGLVSLNWKTDELQLIQYDRIEHKPSNPTGLTYGPDNTLYVLANSIIIEYRVQH